MKKILLLLLLVFISGKGLPQIKNVVIDLNKINRPNEPCIAIDPHNTSKMVAGANLNYVYYSEDGGNTWYKDTMYSTLGVYGDPVILADTSGAFYYIHNCRNYSIPTWSQWFDRITCQRTEDINSHTWTNGGYTGWAPTPTIEDKPWGAIDYNNNTMYLTWTRFDKYESTSTTDSSIILFSKSTDKGDIWSTPKRLNKNSGDCSDTDGTVEGAVPCIGPNGEVFVGWAKKNAIVFNRSTDGGENWLDSEKFVTDVPDGWDYNIPGIFRCNGLPFTACDISNSPHRGTIYINWTDQRNGTDNTDVWICKSTDNGDSWSAPIKVNNDIGAHQQFMSSMSVDPVTGIIFVMFYDRRNYVDTPAIPTLLQHATDVYMAFSKDGGLSFNNIKISDGPFYPSSNIFFGDYTYIAAYNNVIRPIWGCLWSSADTLMQEIRTAIVDSSILGIPELNYKTNNSNMFVNPNPVKDNASISIELPEPDYVTLYITDVTGRIVATIKENNLLNAGFQKVNFKATDYDLKQGMYFLNMKTTNFNKTIKLLIVK